MALASAAARAQLLLGTTSRQLLDFDLDVREAARERLLEGAHEPTRPVEEKGEDATTRKVRKTQTSEARDALAALNVVELFS